MFQILRATIRMPPASRTECSTDHRFLLSWVGHGLNVIFVVQKLLKKTEKELNYWGRSR